MELLLYIGLCGLLYAYGGYALLLAFFPVLRRPEKAAADSQFFPQVGILVSAYNEETRLPAKIDNFQALQYPAGRIDLWIGSDGSADRTAEIAGMAADPRVHCIAMTERSGKTRVLNRLVSETRADILIFTDVNAMFRPDAVMRLIEPFRDPAVGLVSGRTVVIESEAKAVVEGAYVRYERWLKTRESLHGCLTGADGAIYALRRDLYRKMAPDLINDFTHPCQVVLLGYAARFAPAAVCEESPGGGAMQEFSRQVRMAAQSIYVYSRHIGKLIRGCHFLFAWMLTSHKLFRWLGLLWMALIAAGAIAMAGGSRWVMGLLIAQIAFAMAAAAAALFPNRLRSGIFQFPLYFCVVHLAYACGIVQYLRGERYVTWRPRAG